MPPYKVPDEDLQVLRRICEAQAGGQPLPVGVVEESSPLELRALRELGLVRLDPGGGVCQGTRLGWLYAFEQVVVLAIQLLQWLRAGMRAQRIAPGAAFECEWASILLSILCVQEVSVQHDEQGVPVRFGPNSALAGFNAEVFIDAPPSFLDALPSLLRYGVTQFHGLAFRGIGLPSVEFRGLFFWECRFEGSRLAGVRFVACRFNRCNFRGSDASLAVFADCTFEATDFSVANLTGANVDGSTFDQQCLLNTQTVTGVTQYTRVIVAGHEFFAHPLALHRRSLGWEIALGGVALGSVDSDQMPKLDMLIRHPNAEVSAIDLETVALLVDKPEVEAKLAKLASAPAFGVLARKLEPAELSPLLVDAGLGAAEAQGDWKKLKDKDSWRLAALARHLVVLRLVGPAKHADKLLAKILEYLERNPKKVPASLGTTIAKRARDGVRDLPKLAAIKKDPKLAAYLSKTITTGEWLKFTPEPPT